jgi:alkylation response protein AidB-like acyl-CoA dehydrogenase/GNAT superfamily N-acetyltransferase
MQRSPEEEAIYSRYYQFALESVRPAVRTNDDAHTFDRAAWKRLGEADFFRLPISPASGGLGCPLAQCAAALEGLVEGSSDLGFGVSALAHWVCLISLQQFASAAAQARYLPRLLAGDWIGAVANAEPQAGTNLMALASHALQTSSGYELHASKQCITNVGVADLMMVSARLRNVSAHRELNVFLVEAAAAGVETRVLTHLAGLRTSCTGDLTARSVTLPADALVGGVGRGLRIFRTMFTQERLWTGVLYLGALNSCLRRALTHAETRLQFGRPIGRNQYVQERVIRMTVAEQLLRSFLSALLVAAERGDDVSDALSTVKIHGVEAAIEASEDLMRLLGGRGMGKHETAEKFHRDLLALSILGGTVELQKIVLYQELARRRMSEQSAVRAKGADVAITVHEADALEPALETALIELTARLFPDVAELAGRFYYDTRPELVLVAWKDAALAGFLVVPRRQIELGGSPLRVAGLGLGVEPALQRQGIGTALVRRALELLRELGDDLALAVLFSANAEKVLQMFGFRKLQGQLTYLQRGNGQLATESMPVLALDLNLGSLVEDIDAVGRLHLGTGTW